MQPLSVALREIAAIPGARYSCVADGDTGDVLAEHGRPGPDPGAAVRWGTGLGDALRSSGEWEDAMITSDHCYHLLRRTWTGRRSLLVHVCLDRFRGNPAAARRTIADLRFDVDDPPSGVASPVETTASGLPVRPPRPRMPGSASRAGGGTLSAVPPPRRPTSAPDALPGTAGTPPAAAPTPVIPEARGWSDDLHTMSRLLEALRRMP